MSHLESVRRPGQELRASFRRIDQDEAEVGATHRQHESGNATTRTEVEHGLLRTSLLQPREEGGRVVHVGSDVARTQETEVTRAFEDLEQPIIEARTRHGHPVGVPVSIPVGRCR